MPETHSIPSPAPSPAPETFDFGPFEPEIITRLQAYPEKSVSMRYDTHDLYCKILLLPTEEFNSLYFRFLNIPYTFPAPSDEMCEPCTLLHKSLGKTWADVGQLPEMCYFLSAYDAMIDNREPSFAAFTDNPDLFDGARILASCDVDGSLDLKDEASAQSNDLIVALAPHRPLKGLRTLELRNATKRTSTNQTVTDYPPLAVDPSLFPLIEIIRAASVDPRTSTSGKVQKGWLRKNAPEIVESGRLVETHALYAHRGNEAVFGREVWCGLSYCLTYTEHDALEKGFAKLPEAYYQKLFAALQASKEPEGIV